MLREGGGLINLPRALDPLLFAAPTSISFGVNGGAATVRLTDAAGGSGAWTVSTVRQGLPRGVSVAAPATVTVPGRFEVSATVAAERAVGRGDRLRRPHPRRGRAADPVPRRRRPSGARRLAAPAPHQAGRVRGDDEGRREQGRPLPLPDRRRLELSGARGGLPREDHQARGELRRRRAHRPRRSARRLRRRREPSRRVRGPADRCSTRTSTRSASAVPVAGAVLPAKGVYDIVFDTRARSLAGPFRFRFWVNDTKPPTLRLVRGEPGTVTVAVTDGGSGVDPRSLSATIDGHTARVRFEDGKAVVRRGTREARARAAGVGLPGGEEHGGRRPDQAEHGHAHAHRRRRLSATSAAWRRARRSSAATRGRARRRARTPRSPA